MRGSVEDEIENILASKLMRGEDDDDIRRREPMYVHYQSVCAG